MKYNPIVICLFIVFLSFNFYSCYYNARGAGNKDIRSIGDTIYNVKLQLVTDQINDPVDMQICTAYPNRFYISDLKGKISILDRGKILNQPFMDVAAMIAAKQKTAPKIVNENILFGMAFHPEFSRNHKFYICYKAPSEQDGLNKMVVSEFRTSANNQSVADPSTEREILQIHDKVLNDGSIAFGPDGYLYLNFADMDTVGGKLRSQDLGSLLGKLLRIDINKTPYGIPPTNPYVNNKNDRAEIWASGFRKLWRFTFDPKSQMMLGADVGDKKLEEIDIIKKGGNYGWPIVEGDSVHPGNYKQLAATFERPIITYPRTVGVCTIGGYVYEGNALPALRDKYVFGDVNGSVFVLNKSARGKWTRQVIKIKNKSADPLMIYSFAHDEKGEIYVIGRIINKEGMKGEIYKLVKA